MYFYHTIYSFIYYPQKTFKKPIVCPVCADTIEDAIGKKKGHNAIFCDSRCQEWIHWQCAGFSKAAFMAALTSPNPFCCPRCELADVKEKLEALSSEVAGLKVIISSLNKPSSHANSQGNKIQSSNPTNPSYEKAKPLGTPERKFNLVFHGIPESPPGTSFKERLEKDYEVVLSSIDTPQNNLSPSVIQDCVRLSKFQSPSQRPNQCPRSILVKFKNARVVNSILSNRQQLSSPNNSSISIK